MECIWTGTTKSTISITEPDDLTVAEYLFPTRAFQKGGTVSFDIQVGILLVNPSNI